MIRSPIVPLEEALEPAAPVNAEQHQILPEFGGVLREAPRHVGHLGLVDVPLDAGVRGKGAAGDLVQVFAGLRLVREVALAVDLPGRAPLQKTDEGHGGTESPAHPLRRGEDGLGDRGTVERNENFFRTCSASRHEGVVEQEEIQGDDDRSHEGDRHLRGGPVHQVAH